MGGKQIPFLNNPSRKKVLSKVAVYMFLHDFEIIWPRVLEEVTKLKRLSQSGDECTSFQTMTRSATLRRSSKKQISPLTIDFKITHNCSLSLDIEFSLKQRSANHHFGFSSEAPNFARPKSLLHKPGIELGPFARPAILGTRFVQCASGARLLSCAQPSDYI